MSENDAPFSRSWESYTLVDLDGSDFDVDGMALWDKVFAAMKPTCPVCGNHLTPDDLRGG